MKFFKGAKRLKVLKEGAVSPEVVHLYESTLDGVFSGEILTGRVMEVRPEGVVVDVGFKSEGLVPLREFRQEELESLHPGIPLEVVIDELEDAEGNLILSKERAVRVRVWKRLEGHYKKGEPVEGRIAARIKGGLSVDLGGLKAFLPGSQMDIRPVRDFNSLIGQTFPMKILKMDPRRGNIVVSRRALLEEILRKHREETLQTLEEGAVVTGIVKNLTDYGAFIDLGGVDGLLHVTDMSWGRVGHPSELFRVGDKVQVVILKYNKETGRISLGYKQLQPDPWDSVETKYPVGSRVRGRVVSLADYGAFVELEPGVEGLVHISEMSWTHDVKHPSKVVSPGQEVEVMVLHVDRPNRRISLGLKQTTPNPWEIVEKKYPPGTVIQGKVKNLTDFGAFVGLEEGVDGLIHISDLSWTRHIRHPSEVLKKGQTVSAVVLKVDKDKQRISLGIKQLTPDPWKEEIPKRYPVGTVVKGKITEITDFGIFVELEEGLEGLVHVSETGIEPPTRADEVLKVGDEVMAKVIRLDPQERKIGLSFKAYQEDLERADIDAYLEQQGTQGPTLGDVVRKKESESGEEA